MPKTKAQPKASARQKRETKRALPQLSVVYSENNYDGSAIVERDGMKVIAHTFASPGFTAQQVACLLATGSNILPAINRQLPAKIDIDQDVTVAISGATACVIRKIVGLP